MTPRPGLARQVPADSTIEELELEDTTSRATFREANEAARLGDLVRAEQLFRDVAGREPSFDHARRRLCQVLLAQGLWGDALEQCRAAFELRGSDQNRALLAAGLAASADSAMLGEAAVHAAALLRIRDVDPALLGTACRVVVATESPELLRECVARLEEVSPGAEETHFFAWVLALGEGDYAGAKRRIELARVGGMNPDLVARMERATLEARPWWVRYQDTGTRVGLFWLTGLAALFVAGVVLSWMTLRAAKRLPTVTTGRGTAGDVTLRRIYRSVLVLSCVYYYVSIPIVILLVLALGVGALYGMLAAGRVPVKLLYIVVGVVVISIAAMLKSLFARVKEGDPGVKQSKKHHRRLWGVLHEVAGVVGTRPVDNVYLTPGTDLAVMERGGMLHQLRGHGERCLILGVGVLDGMKLGAFKAILAHEYGHFSNRDTAGGGFALAVRRSMGRMAMELAQGGAAGWFNPAWLFVNGFHRLFLRISQGASRLQEVLADRWAAFGYGAERFEEGLRHVIDRSVRFGAQATAAVDEVVARHLPLFNLYHHWSPDTPGRDELDAVIEKAIHTQPSPYDSHPAPIDRISWCRALGVSPTGNTDGADRAVWDLFDERERLELAMTEQVREAVGAARGVTISGG